MVKLHYHSKNKTGPTSLQEEEKQECLFRQRRRSNAHHVPSQTKARLAQNRENPSAVIRSSQIERRGRRKFIREYCQFLDLRNVSVNQETGEYRSSFRLHVKHQSLIYWFSSLHFRPEQDDSEFRESRSRFGVRSISTYPAFVVQPNPGRVDRRNWYRFEEADWQGLQLGTKSLK